MSVLVVVLIVGVAWWILTYPDDGQGPTADIGEIGWDTAGE